MARGGHHHTPLTQAKGSNGSKKVQDAKKALARNPKTPLRLQPGKPYYPPAV